MRVRRERALELEGAHVRARERVRELEGGHLRERALELKGERVRVPVWVRVLVPVWVLVLVPGLELV